MVAQFFKWLWQNHRTKLVGYIGLVFGVLATSPLFPPKALQVFILLNSLITLTIGHFNTAKKRELDAEIAELKGAPPNEP